MPTHDVVAEMNGEPVVVMKTEAADQIHQPCIAVGNDTAGKTLSFAADVVGDQHVGGADLLEHRDHRIQRLGVVAADQSIICSFADERRVKVVLREPLVRYVFSQQGSGTMM